MHRRSYVKLCIAPYQGEGFDLDTIPLPHGDSLAEQDRGLFLIRVFMDSVQYHRTDQGNVLEMRKSLT
jgi:serine/threonine-protein kinase RsbW